MGLYIFYVNYVGIYFEYSTIATFYKYIDITMYLECANLVIFLIYGNNKMFVEYGNITIYYTYGNYINTVTKLPYFQNMAHLCVKILCLKCYKLFDVLTVISI